MAIFADVSVNGAVGNRLTGATGSIRALRSLSPSARPRKSQERKSDSSLLITHRPWTPSGRESRRYDDLQRRTRTRTSVSPRSRPCTRRDGDDARDPGRANSCVRRQSDPARHAAPSPRTPGPAPARGSACRNWRPRRDDRGVRRCPESRRRLIDRPGRGRWLARR